MSGFFYAFPGSVTLNPKRAHFINLNNQEIRFGSFASLCSVKTLLMAIKQPIIKEHL